MHCIERCVTHLRRACIEKMGVNFHSTPLSIHRIGWAPASLYLYGLAAAAPRFAMANSPLQISQNSLIWVVCKGPELVLNGCGIEKMERMESLA